LTWILNLPKLISYQKKNCKKSFQGWRLMGMICLWSMGRMTSLKTMKNKYNHLVIQKCQMTRKMKSSSKVLTLIIWIINYLLHFQHTSDYRETLIDLHTLHILILFLLLDSSLVIKYEPKLLSHFLEFMFRFVLTV